jgi:hypothetical protein
LADRGDDRLYDRRRYDRHTKVSTAPMIDSATAHAVGRIALDRVAESGATLGLAGRSTGVPASGPSTLAAEINAVAQRRRLR